MLPLVCRCYRVSAPPRVEQRPSQSLQVETEVVNALLHSLERKQRECDKAYELMQGKDLIQALRQQALLSEIEEERAHSSSGSRKSSPARPRTSKVTAVRRSHAAKRKPGARSLSDTESSLGGRVINQLIKHAKDSDTVSQEAQEKYQKALLDVASLRRQLKDADAQSGALKKQLKHHQEEEHNLRQRLMEQRVKVA